MRGEVLQVCGVFFVGVGVEVPPLIVIYLCSFDSIRGVTLLRVAHRYHDGPRRDDRCGAGRPRWQCHQHRGGWSG